MCCNICGIEESGYPSNSWAYYCGERLCYRCRDEKVKEILSAYKGKYVKPTIKKTLILSK